jgi:hypothetical protein
VTVLERAEYFEKGGANVAGAVTVVSFAWLIPVALFGMLISAYSR